jgi:hypothetical protein
MSAGDDVLRRHLIAIATDTFAADATFPPLDVASELRTVADWLTDESLGDRRFTDEGYEVLARSPRYDQIRQLLTGDPGFTSGDAVVLYVTGHGHKDQGVHWVVLRDSDPSRLSHNSLGTAELIRWLAAYRDLTHVLIIIDLCQAGDVADEIPAALQRDLPEGWFVLCTASAGVDAGLGAFSGVLESVIADLRSGTHRESNDQEPYLRPSYFVEELQRRLTEKHRQKLVSINQPYGPSVCLPNPRYDATRLEAVATNPARRDLALSQSALDTHWLHRAPVTFDQGSVFTGRRRLMTRLIDVATGPADTLVVAGRAGCGKSAALARLVTCSDAAFRQQYAHVLAVAEPVPPADSVDVAVLATGKTPDQIAQQIADGLGAGEPQGDGLTGWITAIWQALGARDGPATLVIDGLDEASDPTAVTLTLLERLTSQKYGWLRLLIGVRSSGSGATTDQRGRELADLVVDALGARRLQADADEFWEEEDLAGYAAQLLAHGEQPSPEQSRLAARIAGRSGRSYLLTGLVARHLAEPSADSVSDALLREVVETGVRDLVLQDLESSIPDPAMRDKALRLLRTAALSFGRGIPWRDLWARAATAIDGAVPVDQDDVARLLNQRASGYLIRDMEDGGVVYRLFHDELKSALTEGRPGDVDETSAHLAITRTLMAHAGWEWTLR